MAGAVPQSRGGSGTNTIVMVVSIVVAVLLLGALIWLITQQEQLRTTAEQATAAKAKLAAGGEENTARQMFPGAGKTLLGEVIRGTQALCRGMTGNEKDTPPTVLAKLNESLKKLADDENLPEREQMGPSVGAVNIINSLYTLYDGERKARQVAKADLDKAKAELAAAQQKVEELQKGFSAELAAMKKKVDELQLAKSEFEAVKNSETQTLASQISEKQQAMDTLRREHAERTRQLRTELQKSEGLLNEQKQALLALRGPPAIGAQELARAREPVGVILRALPGDSLIAIDLGREDGVTLGMPFTIYSANERVPADGQGKALVEVVSVGRHSAECRVTSPSPPDDPILEGDKAGNILLSRDRGKKPRFCLVGEFDIDFDGQIDPRGLAAVKALVERFGGVVVDQVDANTDYLVLGLEPAAGPTDLSMAVASAAPSGEPMAKEAQSAEAKEEAPPEQPAAEEAGKPAEKQDEGADEGGDAEAKEEPAEGGEEQPAEQGEEAKPDNGEQGGEEPAAEEGASEGQPEAQEGKPADAKTPAETKPAGQQAPAEMPKAAPATPSITKPGEVDLTAGPRTRRALTERQRYELAVQRAEKFAIPRLPLDRFYNFIGLERGSSARRYLEGG